MAHRLTLMLTALLGSGCASMPADPSDLAVGDREDAIVATLLDRLDNVETYCLRVFGQSPSPSLVRKLRDVGYDEVDDCDGSGEARITDVELMSDGTIAVDYVSYGGAIYTKGTRLFLRRNWAGKMMVVGRAGTIET